MRLGQRQLGAVVFAFAAVLWATPAHALPPVASTTYSSDQLQFTVKVPSIAIDGDPRSYCSIEISMVGSETDTLASGDVVSVQVRLDDGYWTDTTLFSSTYSVTSAEATSNKFQRTIDCTGNFRSSGQSTLKIYGFVDGDTDAWMSNRRGTSNTVAISVKADDSTNLSAGQAAALGTGVTSRICAKDNWYSLSVNGGTANVTLTFDGGSGMLDLALTDSGGTTVASGTRFAAGMTITKTGLSAGTYKVKVSPRSSTDPNFYDLAPTASNGGGGGSGEACTGSGTQQRDCGNCGKQTRTCNGSMYSAWGTCSGAGECAPGDSQTTDEGCPTGQRKTLTCSSTCGWQTGTCSTSTTDGGGNGTGTGQNGGMVGRSCLEAADCGGTLTCTGPDDADRGMFRNGYCSIEGCNADSVCRDGSAICGALFGDTFCLSRCSDGSDCRTSYVCARFGDARACVPKCRDDSDCGDSALPYCDTTSGLCLTDASARPQDWNGGRPNADGSTSGNGNMLDDGGGCSAIGSSWLSLLGLVCVIAVRGRFKR